MIRDPRWSAVTLLCLLTSGAAAQVPLDRRTGRDTSEAARAARDSARAVRDSLHPRRATTEQGNFAGMALFVDGKRRIAPGPIVRPRQILLTNGSFRLTWYPEICERAAMEAETKVGPGRWVAATAHCSGDWVYPGGPVQTQPTDIELVRIDTAVAVLTMRFGDHWIRPHQLGFPSWYQDQAYPFTRTIWLRAGDFGYFTEIVLEKKTFFPYPDLEHEVGFGGLWGPARVRTSRVDYRTEELDHTLKHNLDRRVEAGELVRDGAQLYRTLVPLGGNPMITPKFPDKYGGLYVYATGPISSYGAYLSAVPLAQAQPARTICQYAWTHVPFPVPRVSNAQLDACGPAGPPIRPDSIQAVRP